MPVYQYVAINAQGKSIKGKIDSVNLKSASFELRNMQLVIKKLEVESFFTRDFQIGSSKVPLKERSIFCRQIGTLLKSGVPILKSIEILMKQTKHKKLFEILYTVQRRVKEGSSMSLAFSYYKDQVGDFMVYMIEAGEASGSLDNAFVKLADYFEFENNISRKVKTAMIYPIILLIVLVAAVTAILMFVMPRFMSIYDSSGANLPAFTQLFLNISNFLRGFWWLLLILIGISAYGISVYLKTYNGRRQYDSLLLNLPLIGGNVRQLIAARFTRTLSTLLESGIPLASALDIVAKVLDNNIFKEVVSEASRALKKGNKLANALLSSNMFPPMVVSMIEVGEESGSLDALLSDTATFYDREVEEAIKGLLSIIEPVLILIMALVIGSVVIAMLLPIFGLVSVIK